MSLELQALLLVSRHLPRVRGSGTIGHWLADRYRRKPRPAVVSRVLGFQMELDPMEYVDGDILFVPQIYDRRELVALSRRLRPGDVFLDVGCHTGFYALFASALVGDSGRVYAIDADPHSIARTAENARLNGMANIDPVHAGLSDRDEVRRFGINKRGNRGSSSFAQPGDIQLDVPCYSLAHFLGARGITHARAIKLDIEGFAVRVLRQFFRDTPPDSLPALLVVEDEEGVGDLVTGAGYRVTGRSGLNFIFQREPERR